MENYKIKTKIVLPVFLVDILILCAIFIIILNRNIQIRNFNKNIMQIYEKNKESIFKVEKIVICSSANAIDFSPEQNFQDLSIYQYTDIAIYIDNGEELSNKNTVSKLYIDNISIEGKENKENKYLNYKNTLNVGMKPRISEPKEEKNIDFNIVYTNEQNETANYDNPTFYTDCSNPITLEYINYNLKQNFKMEQNNSVVFNGSILEKAGIPKDVLDCKIKFKINIINNKNEKYNCWISLKIPLDDIYSGTSLKMKNTNEGKYIFFRE